MTFFCLTEFRLCWAFFTIKEFDKNVGRWYFPGMFFLTFGREPAVFCFGNYGHEKGITGAGRGY